MCRVYSEVYERVESCCLEETYGVASERMHGLCFILETLMEVFLYVRFWDSERLASQMTYQVQHGYDWRRSHLID